MKATKHTVTEFRITWEADHEQYWQGHGVAFTDYDLCATGCGGTLSEAFDDAMCQLADMDIDVQESMGGTFAAEAITELITQVKKPEMLDWDIVKGYCDDEGEHFVKQVPCHEYRHSLEECGDDCEYCDGTGMVPPEETRDEDPDCSVCAGEWHFYVNVDVKLQEGDVCEK